MVPLEELVPYLEFPIVARAEHGVAIHLEAEAVGGLLNKNRGHPSLIGGRKPITLEEGLP